ncbi:MAG: hypothetical protein DSZ30_05755 [Aquificaceae bacterium]|nr:MAG: hypothetical protein DSZ30_05755 [Aquificaceae bacterium]
MILIIHTLVSSNFILFPLFGFQKYFAVKISLMVVKAQNLLLFLLKSFYLTSFSFAFFYKNLYCS